VDEAAKSKRSGLERLIFKKKSLMPKIGVGLFFLSIDGVSIGRLAMLLSS